MIPVKKPISRWITLATVQERFVCIRNWGVPGGLSVAWRGRQHPFMTCEFLHWHQLLPVVYRRLATARLEAIAVACSVPPRGWNAMRETKLICLVKRAPPPIGGKVIYCWPPVGPEDPGKMEIEYSPGDGF